MKKKIKRNSIFRLCLIVVWVCTAIETVPAVQGEETTPVDRIVVKQISEVKLSILKSNPPKLSVSVIGEVTTTGYTEVQLHRAPYAKPPGDGIQDYFLTAIRPKGIVAQVVTPVEASDIIADYETALPWLKGVRIHGTGKGVEVKLLNDQ
ncbi:MAG: hypothetical protein KA152_12590 [Verrucomicrobiales bacterium]|nr:hypothetical protein [Verrucomicrobiales bacterium]